ncbi:hypothetical protein CXX78_01330 [Candidatus Parvarchaeota archaeon]|nr:MAG: hypothetical protein CXX78_01330 [Candidatus Parvarchaeota archaeon]
MNKKVSFFISISFTLLFIGNYFFFFIGSDEKEKIVIERVIDGDTIELNDGRKVRLLNINSPEKGEFGYEEATKYLKNFEKLTLEIETEGVGKYGRELGRLFLNDIYLNLEIVELGLAHPYIVENEELKKFKKAENKARDKKLGIWKNSVEEGCLNVEINKKDEYVYIENDCGNLAGWKIKDESTKTYEFANFYSEKFKLYSSKGVDENGKLYWGKEKVWNDDKDSIFIRDSEGFLVYYDSYGY